MQGFRDRQVGQFKIVSPSLNIKIYSISEKTLIKVTLCEWYIDSCQEKCLHA